jgi:hypothetical protein
VNLHAFAATYVDDMAELWNTDYKNYQLLSSPQSPEDLAKMVDNTAFTFASHSSPSGWVDYRVTGAERITVTLYSHTGAFAQPVGGGRYILGIQNENGGDLSSTTQNRALYSHSHQGVYARINGVLHQAYCDGKRYYFEPTTNSPADLIGYGVNIYVSDTGSGYRRLPLTTQNFSYTTGDIFSSEILSAKLPAGTAFIRVELNDVNKFPPTAPAEADVPKPPSRFNALASVALTGDHMVFGIPAPVLTRPYPTEPTEETEPPSSSSRTAYSRRATASGSGGTSSRPSSASSKFAGVISAPVSTQKFEGVVTVPTNPPKAEPRDDPKEPTREQPTEPPPTAPVSYAQPAAVVYQEGADVVQRDSGTPTWIMIYIAVIAVATIVAVVRPDGRKGK